MLALLTLAAALAAAPPPKLAQPGLTPVNISPAEADAWAGVVAQRLQSHGFLVMTSQDVAALLGLERQKALLGCTESAECLAEIGGALGVEGLVTGDVGALSGGASINLRVLSPKLGRAIALHSGFAQDKARLRGLVLAAADDIARQLSVALERPDLAPAVKQATGVDRRWFTAAPAALAVGLGIVGGVQLAAAGDRYTRLGTVGTVPEATTLRNDGVAAQDAARLAFVGAAVSAVGAVALFFALAPPADEGLSLSVAPAPGGLVVGGTF